MFAPKRSNLALGLKHVNWLKVWNFHLSQIIFSRIQQQNIPQVLIVRGRRSKMGEKSSPPKPREPATQPQATGAEAFKEYEIRRN